MTVGFMPLVASHMVAISHSGKGKFGDFPRLKELWGILEHTLCPPGGQA
ncbi:unnamed protein product, partial [Rotaria sp. Silwood1]